MTASNQGGSTGDPVQSLSADLAALVRQELQRAQEELSGKARQAGRAGAMLGGAAVLGAMAAGTSATLLRRMLERRLPPAAAAFVTTALLGGAAGALASAGLAELRRAWPLVPEETVAGVRKDVRVATEQAPPGTTAP